jgi:hypothetical protein
MRVYRFYNDAEHYCSVMALDGRDKEAYLFTEIGKPIASTHKPIPVKIFIKDNRKAQIKAKSQLKGDFFGFGGNDPVYSEHAIEVLGDTLKKYGELLLLVDTDGTKYYAYRCTNRKDHASDRDENDRRREANGGLADIYDVSVKREVIGEDEIFLCANPYGTYYTDKFKRRVEEAGLKGGKFIEVWSDEEASITTP